MRRRGYRGKVRREREREKMLGRGQKEIRRGEVGGIYKL